MPQFGQQDKTEEYDREEVLRRLRENFEQHQAEVDKLKKKRAKALAKEFRKQAKKADEGYQTSFSWTSNYPVILDYSEEYERAIDRFTTQKSDTVRLDSQEFNQYMRNEWSWRHTFMASASSYAG